MLALVLCIAGANVCRPGDLEFTQESRCAAKPGNMLVSPTVKDVVAGSASPLRRSVMRSFLRIEGEWRLFTVVGVNLLVVKPAGPLIDQ